MILPVYKQGAFLPQDSGTSEHSSCPCPGASGSFKGQNSPHFWEGEVEWWRYELAFPWLYRTNSPRISFLPPSQERRFWDLLPSQEYSWYNVKHPKSSTAQHSLALNSSCQWLATWNGDLSPKGQEWAWPRLGPLLEGIRWTPDTSASLTCGPTGDKWDRVTCQSLDHHLRQWVTVGKEQTPPLAGPGETSQNEHVAAKPL